MESAVCMEDEVKFRVPDNEVDLLKSKIRQTYLNTEELPVFERNMLFDLANRRLEADGWRLRLREECEYDGSRTSLSYAKRSLTLKSVASAAAREKPNLVRREINFDLDKKGAIFFEIMRVVSGLERLFLYEKIRQDWRLIEPRNKTVLWAMLSSRPVLATLSQLPRIGYMLGIEGPGNLNVARDLGLNPQNAVRLDTYELYRALEGSPRSVIVSDAVFDPPIIINDS